MRWTWRSRTMEFRGRDRTRPASRSFKVAEGVAMPSTGDVLMVGTVAGLDRGLRVTGTQGRTAWYQPLELDGDLLGAARWTGFDDPRGARPVRLG